MLFLSVVFFGVPVVTLLLAIWVANYNAKLALYIVWAMVSVLLPLGLIELIVTWR